MSRKPQPQLFIGVLECRYCQNMKKNLNVAKQRNRFDHFPASSPKILGNCFLE